MIGIGMALTALRARLTDIFPPASLRANGANVLFFDPSDLSTMFQDADGTVPVTAPGQPVGLWLDKGKGVGPNLITNSTFDNGVDDWAANQPSTILSYGEDGTLVFTRTETTGAGGVVHHFPTVAERYYRLTATLVSSTDIENESVMLRGGSTILPIYHTFDAPGTASGVFKATGSSSSIYLRGAVGVHAWDNAEAREILGNHATQSVAPKRPTYQTGEGLHWLDFDGVDDFMETREGILVNDNWFVSYGALNTIETRSDFRGPWRWLVDGGSPTSTLANLLEEYGGNLASSMRRRAIYSRVNRLGPAIDDPQGVPVDGTAFVAWANRGTTERGYGSYFTGSNVGNIALSDITGPTTGAGSLSIGRGHGGALMQYRNYGIVFVWGDVSTANRIAVNKYLAAKTGVTI